MSASRRDWMAGSSPAMTKSRFNFNQSRASRMGGRAVEGTGLENRQTCKGLVGSNPTPSTTSNGPLVGPFEMVHRGEVNEPLRENRLVTIQLTHKRRALRCSGERLCLVHIHTDLPSAIFIRSSTTHSVSPCCPPPTPTCRNRWALLYKYPILALRDIESSRLASTALPMLRGETL